MRKIIKYSSILLVFILVFTIRVRAESKSLYVNLENLEYSNDQQSYESITEYKTLEDFLKEFDQVDTFCFHTLDNGTSPWLNNIVT